MYFHLGSLYVWVFQRNNSLFCEWELAMNINVSENLMQSTVAFCDLQNNFPDKECPWTKFPHLATKAVKLL